MSLDRIEIFTIDSGSHFMIKEFLEHMNAEKSSFRYFDKRNLSVLKNHVETVILKVNKSFAGYGHLDKEGDIVWLGIVVLKEFQGMGFGAKIMNELIKKAIALNLSFIKLSVDTKNLVARALYVKKGFRLIKETKEICYYSLYFN